MQELRRITFKEASAITPIIDYRLDDGTATIRLRLASGEEVVLITCNQQMYRRLLKSDQRNNRPAYACCQRAGRLRLIWWPSTHEQPE